MTLLDTPGFAKVCKRVRRCPARWARRCFLWNRAPSWFSHVLVGRGRKPDWNALVLASSFHVRSGDLVFRDAPRRPDGRGQQGHRAQQLSVVIPSCPLLLHASDRVSGRTPSGACRAQSLFGSASKPAHPAVLPCFSRVMFLLSNHKASSLKDLGGHVGQSQQTQKPLGPIGSPGS